MKIRHLVLIAVSCATIFSSHAIAEEMDETKLKKAMKELGDTARRFKKHQDEQNGGALAQDLDRVAKIYRDSIPFWKERHMENAVKWSHESETAAKATAKAANGQDWNNVKANLQSLMKNCKACHDAHREKLDDGSYRIKIK